MHTPPLADGSGVEPTAKYLSLTVGVLLTLAASAPLAAAPITYGDVAPMLAAHCIMCHSGATAPLDLRLDSFDAVLKGSSRGPVVKAGAPSDSELMRRLRGASTPRMPMTGPPFLTDAEIATFERWIADGLPKGESRPNDNPSASAPRRPVAGEFVTYRHVAPIFATRCAKCHSDKGLMGTPPEGYILTSYESTLSSSDRARVLPGQPGASELMRRILGHARPRMPFDGPPYLGEEDIRLIEDWIVQGARDSKGTPASLPAGTQVRLHGTLGRAWHLDGFQLDVRPTTRIDKSPRIGDYTEVRGHLERKRSTNPILPGLATL
ncbi:Planctomycete cytochrome C [Azoarcus sp. Aa7]|nr:Planctomycete cytochrome C [Azoarcus sp. Aa7]